jgi:hypothetical protein
MKIDYTQGQYIVAGADGAIVGRIDHDEFVRSGSKLLYRFDGDDEFYDMSGRLLGFVDNGLVTSPDGRTLFSIRAE